jgi:hypothetical protein
MSLGREKKNLKAEKPLEKDRRKDHTLNKTAIVKIPVSSISSSPNTVNPSSR